jgi:GH24 family phage-related lysozyme (muramidase)
MSLRAQLIRDEGSRSTVYADTKGNITFGVGHLGTTPLSAGAISHILDDDIGHAVTDLANDPIAHPIMLTLSATRCDALTNMAFTLGVGGLTSFHDLWKALAAHDYAAAAGAIRASLWWRDQARGRAERLAKQIETDIEQ